MPILDELAAGTHGVVAMPPPGAVLQQQDEHFAHLVDAERSLAWWFCYFPDLGLDHRGSYARDVARHTRALFAALHAATGSTEPPRTADPAWSPLIECVPAGGAAGAFHILHHVFHQADRESIMGHTLVPVANGLFEVRWMCGTPAVARAAKQWVADGRLRVTEPVPAFPKKRILMSTLGCSLVPPPRFLQDGVTSLSRVSFSGTDGLDKLVIERAFQRPADYAAFARGIFQESGLGDIALRRLDNDVVITEGDPPGAGGPRARCVWHCRKVGPFHWSFALNSSVAVPVDELIVELGASVQSLRLVDPD